ncbi:hypothetical protein ACRZ5Y_005290 [Klebsiella pneumoniae]
MHYHNVFVQKDFDTSAGAAAVTFGINNLFDQDAPYVFGESDFATYDPIGRYFFLKATLEM